MALPERMKFGIFLAPFHEVEENPTLALERDLELLQWLDYLGFDEAWIGEHHSGGWETIASPEVFIATAAERTRHINLGTGVISLPYHHPLLVANRMVLLDHLTRGRAMMGVGPGSLVSDSYLMGIDPVTQRRRMDESLGVIMRLLTETEPISHEAEWFTLREARLHLRPYSRPHFPVAVAASQSPSGMVLAGKYGLAVLSPGVLRKGGVASKLNEFWRIAEETAAEHGKAVKRKEWRLVLHVHLAESRKEAMEQARARAGHYQRLYLENTLGQESGIDGPADEIIDVMVERGAWCVGTPDDLIATIRRLGEESDGFGGFLVQATEWGTREQVLRSYELIARHVMPHFQGSLPSLTRSQQWTAGKMKEFRRLRSQAMDRAGMDHLQRRQSRVRRATCDRNSLTSGRLESSEHG